MAIIALFSTVQVPRCCIGDFFLRQQYGLYGRSKTIRNGGGTCAIVSTRRYHFL